MNNETVILRIDKNSKIAGGNIVSTDIIAESKFEFKESKGVEIDFSYKFKQQSPTEEEIDIFNKMQSAILEKDKRGYCLQLKEKLRDRHSPKTTNDLIAIAINDSAWQQDKTDFACMAPQEALNYRTNSNLENITYCSNETCLRSINAAKILKNDDSPRTLDLLAGDEFEKINSCKRKTNYSGFIINPNSVHNGNLSPIFESYEFETFIIVENTPKSYISTFFWNNTNPNPQLNKMHDFFCRPASEDMCSKLQKF